MDPKDTRSSLARAIGLGSAQHGTAHWWAQRTSAIALIPLTLWFVASIIAQTSSDHAHFVAWLRSPFVNLPMALLLGTSFYHAALGLQVVIEDYIHSGLKYGALIAVRLTCFVLAFTGIMAVLRITFSSNALS